MLANSKNKKIAEKAEAQTRTVKTETNKLAQIRTKVNAVAAETKEMSEHLTPLLKKVIGWKIKDFHDFSDEQAEQVIILINVTGALSEKLCEKVN